MNTLKKISLLLVLVSFTFFSCEDDGGTSKIDLIEGVIPNLSKSLEADQIIDFQKLTNNEPISLKFNIDIHSGNPQSSDVVALYKKRSDGSIFYALLEENADLPKEYSMTPQSIVDLFSELNSVNDIELGDVVTLTARFTLNDGTLLNIINEEGDFVVGTNIQNNTSLYTISLNYPVSCVSDLAGTYSVLSSGTSTDGGASPNPISNHPYEVVITDTGGGTYTISDGAAGIYIQWYSQYGYTFETEGKFTDVCGTLNGSWGESFGGTITLTGTVNNNGTLSIHWENSFGDVVDAIYTKM
ncbi:hypothetical protein [Tenacibaculum sp.]|uniref:hypothetical protein n=1 Tax=Tenacibaculum sp. TaxID=1906242 RepID=UPI003AA8CDED